MLCCYKTIGLEINFAEYGYSITEGSPLSIVMEFRHTQITLTLRALSIASAEAIVAWETSSSLITFRKGPELQQVMYITMSTSSVNELLAITGSECEILFAQVLISPIWLISWEIIAIILRLH